MKKAIFLDKDGTLIHDLAYNVDPDKIILTPFALESLRMFSMMGYLLIVVSNQSGVARGYFEEHQLGIVYNRIQKLLIPAGIGLDGFYYCPHHPQGRISKYTIVCTCRKPSPGLLYKAALLHDINLAESWMVGDILNDVEAGRRAGCKTVLIDNGNETEWVKGPQRNPHYTTDSLLTSANVIYYQSIKNNILYE